MDAKTHARFWSKVDKAGAVPSHCPDLGPCWVWTGFIAPPLGYGHFRLGPRAQLAHRMAWWSACGALPDGACVLHRCDNRRCVNPAHLYLATRKDVSERYKRPRKERVRAAIDRRCKLTVEQVQQVRGRRAAGTKMLDLAREYGITVSMVSLIASGKRRVAA